jgi:NAD+ kinase
MVVLIVVKTTNYELHGAVIEAKVAQKRVSEDALTRLKTAHSEHYRTLAALKEALAKAGLAFDEVSRDRQQPQRSYDVVVTVGGDGTLLAATHQMAAGGLIFGVRSSNSSVGFLCCAGPDDTGTLVRSIVDGSYRFEDVPRLTAELRRIDRGETVVTKPVLNDFLYTNSNPAATTRYKITFRGKAEAQRSSGIWVSTGAGSTAAILAAGGSRRPLTDSLAQFRVRELYRLGVVEPEIDGGLFDPEAETLEVENRCPQAILALDGQHGMMELVYGDMVRFRRAPPIRLGRPHT